MSICLKKELYEFAYSEAVDDSTRRSFSGKTTVENIRKNESAKEAICSYVTKGIKKGVDLSDFLVCCDTVLDSIDDPDFSFGNAQKLINMTVKHLFISCYLDKTYRNSFKSFDCAMDRLMIHKVWMKYKTVFPNDKETRIFVLKGIRTSDCSKIAWSDLDKSEGIDIYLKYQNMIRNLAKKEGVSPIEWELKEFNRR